MLLNLPVTYPPPVPYQADEKFDAVIGTIRLNGDSWVAQKLRNAGLASLNLGFSALFETLVKYSLPCVLDSVQLEKIQSQLVFYASFLITHNGFPHHALLLSFGRSGQRKLLCELACAPYPFLVVNPARSLLAQRDHLVYSFFYVSGTDDALKYEKWLDRSTYAWPACRLLITPRSPDPEVVCSVVCSVGWAGLAGWG